MHNKQKKNGNIKIRLPNTISKKKKKRHFAFLPLLLIRRYQSTGSTWTKNCDLTSFLKEIFALSQKSVLFCIKFTIHLYQILVHVKNVVTKQIKRINKTHKAPAGRQADFNHCQIVPIKKLR